MMSALYFLDVPTQFPGVKTPKTSANGITVLVDIK